jgi:hypothetical protein
MFAGVVNETIQENNDDQRNQENQQNHQVS